MRSRRRRPQKLYIEDSFSDKTIAVNAALLHSFDMKYSDVSRIT